MESLSWPDVFPAKDVLLFMIRMIHRYLFQVKQARFAGVGFLIAQFSIAGVSRKPKNASGTAWCCAGSLGSTLRRCPTTPHSSVGQILCALRHYTRWWIGSWSWQKERR